MKQLLELVEQSFPEVIDRGQQPVRTWLENNGWKYVEGEGDASVFHDPVTDSNYILEQCIYRQSQRPFELTVCHLLRSLKAGAADELSAEVAALNGKISEANGFIKDLTLERDAAVATLASANAELEDKRSTITRWQSEAGLANDALAAAKSEIQALTAQVAALQSPAAPATPTS